MKVLTACAEAVLVVVLFALLTVPFFVVNGLNASQMDFSTIAQTFSK